MKKNYENNQLIITVVFLYLLLFVFVFFLLFKTKYRTYNTINGILITDNYIEVIVSSKDLRLLSSSKYLYIDNVLKKVKIISTKRGVIKKNDKLYHEVILRVKTPNKYKDNDSISLTIYNNRKRIISIFKSCFRR